MPSNHLLIAKSLVGDVPDENSVDYAAVSYVPGEAILKGIREYRNSPQYGSVSTDLSISGGTTTTTVNAEREFSYRYEVTFDRPEKLLESPCVYSDGTEGKTKAFVEVETDVGELFLPTREESGKFFPVTPVSGNQGLTPLVNSKTGRLHALPDSDNYQSFTVSGRMIPFG